MSTLIDLTKIVYKTNVYDVVIRKEVGMWILEVVTDQGKVINIMQFQFFETAKRYAQKNYLSGVEI